MDGSDQDAARAVQAWAPSRKSDHKYLMMRLFDLLVSADSKSQFDAAGFQWLYRHAATEAAGQSE